MTLARIYLKMLNGLYLVGRGLEAVFRGVWLGLLDKRALDALDTLLHEDSGMYRDEAYNRQGLHDWEARAVQTYFKEAEHLLVGAAGGGRELVGLSALGYRADGFECNPVLVDSANALFERIGVPAQVTLAARDSCPQRATRYDGGVIGWGGYMFIQGRGARVAFLQAFRRNLTGGAPLLLSFHTRDGGEKGFKITAQTANLVRRVLGRPLVDVGDTLYPNYAHFFTEVELRGELAEGNFELLYYGTDWYGHAVARAVMPEMKQEV